jgi:hypothetical protein
MADACSRVRYEHDFAFWGHYVAKEKKDTSFEGLLGTACDAEKAVSTATKVAEDRQGEAHELKLKSDAARAAFVGKTDPRDYFVGAWVERAEARALLAEAERTGGLANAAMAKAESAVQWARNEDFALGVSRLRLAREETIRATETQSAQLAKVAQDDRELAEAAFRKAYKRISSDDPVARLDFMNRLLETAQRFKDGDLVRWAEAEIAAIR